MKLGIQQQKYTVSYLNSHGIKKQMSELDSSTAKAVAKDFRKRGLLSVEVQRVSQPLTRSEVLKCAMVDHYLAARQCMARLAYKRSGMPLDRFDPNIKLITAAKYEAKTRLGRSLTPTELSDIKGWAGES